MLAPVVEVELIVSGLGLSGGWRFGLFLSGNLGLTSSLDLALDSILVISGGLSGTLLLMSVGLGGLSILNNTSVLIEVVESWSNITLLTPVIKLLLVLNSLLLGGSWASGGLLHVNLGLSLEQVAVVESALNPVEEVSNELSLFLLSKVFHKLRVDLLLEELVHVNFQVGLEESLLSGADLVHVGVQAHGLDLSHHLGLRLDLGGFGRSSQKEEDCEIEIGRAHV